MMDNKVKLHPENLYSYNAGGTCSVLVTEGVMKELAKLQAMHLHKVKKLLNSRISEVYPSGWTLHYPDGVQTMVDYIEDGGDVAQQIKWATTANKPVHKPLVFIASSMNEAAAMADAFVLSEKEQEV